MINNIKMDERFFEIFNYIDTLKVIDTHEHLPCREEDRLQDVDVIQEFLAHYFNSDLISAGLPKKDYKRVMEEKMPVTDRWKIVGPYWDQVRYTGYGRALSISAKDLYGIDKIDSQTISALNSKFLKTLVPGRFKEILKNRCNIETSLICVDVIDSEYDPAVDRSAICDRELFSPVYMLKDLVYPYMWSQFERIERQSEIKVTSFSNYLEAVEVIIEKAYAIGVVALKNYLAYLRSLKYERVTRSEAEEDFNQIFKTKHIPDWHDRPAVTGKRFQDYIFHFILNIASKKNLTVQIHTGIQEGSGNILANSDPKLLTNLFLEYPDVSFDIFHMSYPFQNELIVLAKNFQNVYIDMCWAHIVSPNASVNALVEMFDTVPLNKISAFGADYLFIDGVYGHLKLAQQNVSEALSVKVREGLFDMDEAKKIAKMLFYDNPKSIFKLSS